MDLGSDLEWVPIIDLGSDLEWVPIDDPISVSSVCSPNTHTAQELILATTRRDKPSLDLQLEARSITQGQNL